jgi:hypothetical protein
VPFKKVTPKMAKVKKKTTQMSPTLTTDWTDERSASTEMTTTFDEIKGF